MGLVDVCHLEVPEQAGQRAGPELWELRDLVVSQVHLEQLEEVDLEQREGWGPPGEGHVGEQQRREQQEEQRWEELQVALLQLRLVQQGAKELEAMEASDVQVGPAKQAQAMGLLVVQGVMALRMYTLAERLLHLKCAQLF